MVTMFAAAFPLAPAFLWVFGRFDVRLMAGELHHGRRPVGVRAENIGCWEGILAAINVRPASRSISPRWRPIRFRLALRTYAP